MRTLICLFFFLFSSCATAWSAQGHKIVAQIAYNQLTPEAKKQIAELEPDFIKASTWPDRIRKRNKNFDVWHHEQLVPALNKMKKILLDPKSSKKQKRFALRFFVHLVGDIHQPLHCIQDDKGGNQFPVKSPIADNLHGLWDKGLSVMPAKAGIQSKRVLIQENNPAQWFAECRALGQNVAYNAIRKDEVPSLEYIRQGQDVVKSQLALAGYRLAYQLNEIFEK